jgi:hypothetical protein
MIAEIGDFAPQSGTLSVRCSLPISVRALSIDLASVIFMPGFPALTAGAR